MEKMILLLAVMLIPFSYSMEETPLLIDTGMINLDFEEDNNELINTSEMKKTEKIENAKQKSTDLEKRRIKLDSRQLNHQRALDYSTRQQNMMLPLF